MSGPNSPEDEAGSGAGSESSRPIDDEVAAGSDFPSQAYSAPESEQVTSAPYVPANTDLYDYDSYDPARQVVEEQRPPRWPWVVGVTAILAAIALVVSVALLVTKRDTSTLATPAPTTTSAPPVQDEITTTTPPPPPPTTRNGDRDTRTGSPTAGSGTDGGTAAAPAASSASAAADYHAAGGTPTGDVLGHRNEGARRHHLRDLHRRLGPAAHPAERLHSVVPDGHAHFTVGGRLGASIQSVPGEQVELLDHHQ
jgi:hypothetical protein